MNWNKVINVLILLFAFINVTLFVYKNSYENNRYSLPDERAVLVKNALDARGIALYEFIPEYYPTKQIQLEAPSIDKERVKKEMLGDQITITPDNTLGERISNVNESITFYTGEREGYVFYKSENSSYVSKDLTISNVEDVAYDFAKDLFGDDVKMEVTYRKEIEEDLANGISKGYRLELNEVYKDDIILQTFIKLYITEEGIEEALAVRFKPVGYSGSSKNIYPFDEVMYSLMFYLEDESEDQGVKNSGRTIRDIEVGYYLLDVDRRKYLYNVDPHYRIIFESGETFYINAYTNDIIRPE